MSRKTDHSGESDSVLQAVSRHLTDMRVGLDEPVRIREEALAAQLGVSRTPIREALIRLDGAGLVSLRPGRGALLMPVTDRDYAQWLQIREQLEGLAAHQAALNASAHDVAHLRALFQSDMTDAAYAETNVAFHEAIMTLADNDLLKRIWTAFDHLEISTQRQTIARVNRRDQSLQEHLALIEAIAQRDAPLAESLAKAHVRSLAQDVQRHRTEPNH